MCFKESHVMVLFTGKINECESTLICTQSGAWPI